MVSYAVTLDVPRELILFVSGLLAARRREIGTRKGNPQAGGMALCVPRISSVAVICSVALLAVRP